jgi:hypothetical protein
MEKGRQDKIDQDLRIRIKELEITLDQKSPESDLYCVIVDLASDKYKADLKKKFGDQILKSKGK